MGRAINSAKFTCGTTVSGSSLVLHALMKDDYCKVGLTYLRRGLHLQGRFGQFQVWS